MMRYCSKCQTKTETIYNEFMVAFCYECKHMRGRRSDYSQSQPFTCIHCGRSMDTDYAGQSVCSDCDLIDKFYTAFC